MLTKPINIISTVVLARLLDPYDFGIVALGMLLAMSSYLFVDLGMGPAIIQTTMERHRVVFPAFVITMISGSLLTALIMIFSGPLAMLFGEPAAQEVIRWLAWMVFLEAAITIPESLLRKELRFGQVSFLKFLQEFLNLVVSVPLAYLGYGFWSLVYGRIVAAAIQTILAWVLSPSWEWLKPVPFDWDAIRQLLRYGVRATSGGLLSFIHQNWDDWLVGRVLGATALGFYTKAYGLTNNTLSGLSKNLVNGVFFPSYAQMQEDKVRLTRVYMKVLNFVLLMMVPLAAGFLVVAPQIVTVLLGEKWLPVLPVFQIFALLVFTRPISSNTSPLFMAMGRPDYNFQAGIVLMAVMVPAVLLLLPYNITGVALGVVIAHTVAAAYNVYQVNRLLPGTARLTAITLIPPLVASVAMMVGVQLAKPVVLQVLGVAEHNFISLTILCGLGGAIYLGLAFLMQRELLTELLRLGLMGVGGGRRGRRRRMGGLAAE
jgi:O-antigen/teichoic acid export membrane protein